MKRRLLRVLKEDDCFRESMNFIRIFSMFRDFKREERKAEEVSVISIQFFKKKFVP